MADANLWTTDPREALRVPEGFSVAEFDRRSTPGWDGKKKDAAKRMAEVGGLLSELQERLYAEGRAGGKRSVLIVLQGLDTAGKGGIARHVMGLVDPQGVQMKAFGAPTKEELSHHYLWRIKKALPDAGRIGLFDRSHYEDVLPVRVLNLVPKKEWEKRYDEINKWEKELVEGGTIVLKFAMMVSKGEQAMRLMERLDRPDKHWKFSPSDVETRKHWDAYQEAYQAIFDLTNTDYAPWHVLPSDRKWFSRLAITEILTRTLIEMDMAWPKPRWKPETQRRALAKDMATADLAESLADTDSVVNSALAESLDVRREAVELMGYDAGTAEETIAAKTAEFESARESAVAQKQALLADRPDYKAPKESKKGSKSKKKKSKK